MTTTGECVPRFTRPAAPAPGVAANSETLVGFIPWFLTCEAMAAATGCSLWLSIESAEERIVASFRSSE
ncbi:unannotated protein [freshwater metagenome]|uniref:Unannotated protein n=1 Tax=freshwater metagenome TaxID=449393 RepID=A0A6J6QS62_9ZZZZ